MDGQVRTENENQIFDDGQERLFFFWTHKRFFCRFSEMGNGNGNALKLLVVGLVLSKIDNLLWILRKTTHWSHVLSCLALPCTALPSPVLSCLVLSCLVLSKRVTILSCLVKDCDECWGNTTSCVVLCCLVLSCVVLSCLALPCRVLSCLLLSSLVLSFVVCRRRLACLVSCLVFSCLYKYYNR